jgi:hypothetical protein
MRFMGWSYRDLCDMPASWWPILIDLFEEANRED